MAKKKNGRASWFKVFLHQKSLIDAVSDEAAGQALKAALQYFDNKTILELPPLAGAVFATLKEHIDESFDDYQKSVDAGQSGGNKRWEASRNKGDSPPIPSLSTAIGISTDTEADTEADTEREARFAEAGRALSADYIDSTAGIESTDGIIAPAEKNKEMSFEDLRQQRINMLRGL